jgi:D-2-hydroxyacid dehydrogenase (NADP+)
MKVVIGLHSDFGVWRFPEEQLRLLKGRFPEVAIVLTTTEKEFAKELVDADAALCWGLTPEEFKQVRSLRWVHTAAAGVGMNLFPEMVASEVVLTNSSGVHAIPISEHVIGLMLSLSRKLHLAMKLQAGRKWREELIVNESDLPGEVSGKTMGVVGLGAIGHAVAERAHALGMRVIGIRRDWKKPVKFVDELLPPEQLDKLLEESDVVVIACPLTNETRGLISEERLRRMKPDAFLINIARGKIIDQKALIRALREGWIKGAGLDVFEEEPLPETSELWGLTNVIITPHVAGATPEYWPRVASLFADNLRRFLDGKELLNVVDKKLGY